MTERGMLIILSGPSGCGKGTMLHEVVKRTACEVSVSATTREPRKGEIDGVHYHFFTRSDFEKRIAGDEMLEYAEYCNNYYGTLKENVEAIRAQGKHAVLEIEVQGALKVMAEHPDAVTIFTMPPSVEELRRRLYKRATEQQDVIEERIAKAIEEIPYATRYQYIVWNDALEDAVDDFCAIVQAEANRTKYSVERIGALTKSC